MGYRDPSKEGGAAFLEKKDKRSEGKGQQKGRAR
jgi:hypothetical protein